MMKTLIALLSVVTLNASAFRVRVFSHEFFEGAETGLLITDNQEFDDYSCTLPDPTDKVQNYLAMIEPVRKLLDTTASDGRATHPLSDILGKWNSTVEQLGVMFSLMSPSYDCGDFCQGLTMAYHFKNLFTRFQEESRFANLF